METSLLKGKKILLALSGSIAIYKSIAIMQLFKKMGASVRVVMTKEAQKFINPLLFEALSGFEVLHKNSESWALQNNNHISFARWADIMLIAPATANTISKLCYGMADNLLLSTALAFEGKRIIAPAANTAMYYAKPIQEALHILQQRGDLLIPPISKELACKIKDIGALETPEEIVSQSARVILKEDFWDNRTVIITGGGSQEQIDSVRFLSNFSSGKMAQNLALALYLKGADVHLIISQYAPYTLLHTIAIPKAITIHKVHNAYSYQECIHALICSHAKGTKMPYLFMAAAISDYRPESIYAGKLKKEDMGDEFHLKLIKNDDILGSIDKEKICTIGFKLEEKNALENAKKALYAKKLDAICLNTLQSNPLGTDENEICFITTKDIYTFTKSSKFTQSMQIIQQAALLKKGLS